MKLKTIYSVLIIFIVIAIFLQIEWLYIALFILLIALVAVQASASKPVPKALRGPTPPSAMQPIFYPPPAPRRRERPVIIIQRTQPGVEYIQGLIETMIHKSVPEISPEEKKRRGEEAARMAELTREVKELRKKLEEKEEKDTVFTR